jgi:hypothetical protein
MGVLEAQTITAGFKLNPSLGFMRSRTLKQASHVINNNDDHIDQYDVRSRGGFQFGIGGFFQYQVNSKVSILTDPTLNYSRSKITQTYRSHLVTSSNTETQHTIKSTALIKYAYINIPVMVKYELFPRQRAFISGGASVNINFTPTIESAEDSTTNYLLDGEIYETHVKKYSASAAADHFSLIGVNLHAGIGKRFLVGKYYNLELELRYQLPITSTALYTSDQGFAANTLNNSVFSESGRNAINDASGKNIDKFRVSVLSLAIRYTLFTK